MTKGEDIPVGWRVWWLAARPKTLWAAAVPVVIGGALAVDTGMFHVPAFLAALTAALFIQIGTNFANDLYDCLHRADDEDRLGPERATQSRWVTPGRMKAATAIVFTLAFLLGIYLVSRGGIPIVMIGLLSILLGILYTGGPVPLGYLGLGDLLVLIFFGPVAVGGTYYVVTLDIDATVLLIGLSPGMISTAILAVNNLRDIETDRKSGKRTLAVRFGRSFARFEYLLMMGGGIFLPLTLPIADDAHPWASIALFTIVAAIPPIRTVMSGASGSILNEVLASTGRVLGIFGLLFSIGWLL
jgi:1,4-dihydroxy-2-naphthoate octaprenyltransferase